MSWLATIPCPANALCLILTFLYVELHSRKANEEWIWIGGNWLYVFLELTYFIHLQQFKKFSASAGTYCWYNNLLFAELSSRTTMEWRTSETSSSHRLMWEAMLIWCFILKLKTWIWPLVERSVIELELYMLVTIRWAWHCVSSGRGTVLKFPLSFVHWVSIFTETVRSFVPL